MSLTSAQTVESLLGGPSTSEPPSSITSVFQARSRVQVELLPQRLDPLLGTPD